MRSVDVAQMQLARAAMCPRSVLRPVDCSTELDDVAAVPSEGPFSQPLLLLASRALPSTEARRNTI